MYLLTLKWKYWRSIYVFVDNETEITNEPQVPVESFCFPSNIKTSLCVRTKMRILYTPVYGDGRCNSTHHGVKCVVCHMFWTLQCRISHQYPVGRTLSGCKIRLERGGREKCIYLYRVSKPCLFNLVPICFLI